MNNEYQVWKALDERISKLEETNKKLDELLVVFNNAKGTFATLEWMGKTSKILTPLFLIVGFMSFDIKKFFDTVTHFWK